MKLRLDGLTWQEIDGELVILDLAGSVYLTTNGSGGLLAKLLTDERTEQELVDALISTYDIDPAVALTDAQAFVAQLRQKNLLAAD